MPRAQAALEQGKGPVVGVEHHLLRLARIGPHEQHAAVAEPDMGHLHGDRHAAQQDDLVAPVELIGLARRKAQRHIGRGRRLAAFLGPSPSIAAHGIVAAFIATAAQFLEEADQGQAFAWRFAFIRRQQLVEFITPSSDFGERLNFSLVAELSRARADHLPYDFARYAQFPADRFDRLTLPKERTSNLCNRLHDQHSNLGFHESGKPMWTLC